MRTVFTILIWISYLLLFNIYIATFGFINPFYSKLLYCSGGLITLLYCTIEILKGAISGLLKSFIALCLSAVCANFLLLIVYYCIGLNDYKLNFCIFNGIELFTACSILHSGLRRGLFKYDSKYT